jgi:hypothetical protein
MKLFLAVDPGASGGLAWNDITGTRINCTPMPEDDKSICSLIVMLSFYRPTVVIEHVSGFIGKAHPGGAMFSFGENFGFIKGVTLALELELVLVRPNLWQKCIIPGRKKDFNFESVLTKGERKGQTVIKNKWKDNLINHANIFYPKVQGINPKTADALLILHYAKLFL